MDKKFLKWYRLFTGVIHGDKLKNHDWAVWQAALASQQRETIDISELAMEGRKMKKVIDVDGNKYKTVKIGHQVWMAENLKVTHYRNDDAIPNVLDKYEWEESSIGAYCNYGNDEKYVSVYGRLYNWDAVHDSRGLAPAGWHIPTDEEWKQLEVYLGGISRQQADGFIHHGTDEGGRLKEIGAEHWRSPNIGATNKSRFSGIPGGYRATNGAFSDFGYLATFWSISSARNNNLAWIRLLSYNNSGVAWRRICNYMHGGFSVRCVRD